MSGALVVTIVASVAFLCCACGVAVVVCVYRRNRALHRPPPPQTQPTYPMEAGGRYGTNGTFGTLLVEKPPPYPGVPQHTSVIPPDSRSPGNLARPVLGVEGRTLQQLIVLYCLSQ
ncbi:uncharacterized protein [Cherax quadricarinatus]|uniref:uncharacterized protein n=1 Tax=Cherax quadricarinatus TaxID=27406 RepID=UPI002379B85F|nr:uncharacterized protein LOC128697239 [Cherax quadricarinatus]